MQVNTVKQQNISFRSKIFLNNTLGFGVNRAIELGDKGFFNALKHLSNDGLERKIYVLGSNSAYRNFISATNTLYVDNLDYSSISCQIRESRLDAFQLMGENVITLIKKFAAKTGNISKEALAEISTEKEALVKESNEAYRTYL